MDAGIRSVTPSSRLEATWAGVFCSTDPFEWPFHASIENALVLFPTHGYHLTEPQYAAMVAASRAVGDEGFIVSVVEWGGDFIQRGDHWSCAYPGHADYRRLPLVLENAVYSPASQWGILISHEDHALVSGSRRFLAAMRDAYPSADRDLEDLRDEWAGNPRGEWLDKLFPT